MGYTLHSAISALLHLKRQCPKCGREQIVPASESEKTVACKFCHAPMPPPKQADGHAETREDDNDPDRGD